MITDVNVVRARLTSCTSASHSLLHLWPGQLQTSQELVGLTTHVCMQKGLTAFDLIVEIVAKHVDEVDGVLTRGRLGVSREQD